MSNWRAQLEKPQLSLEEFHKLCIAALAELFPDLVVKSGKNLGQLLVNNGEPVTIFLDNLWRNCKRDPGTRVEQVERFLKIMARPKEKSDRQPNTRSIVPMIKDHEYLGVTNSKTGQPALVHEHFVGDLWIVYAIDLPDRMLTLQETQLGTLGLTRESLRQLAVENLKRILPPIERHGEGPVYMLTAGSDYVASLILFEDIWQEFQSVVEGDVVVAVPSRDVLMFTGSDSVEGIRSMRDSIARIHATGAYLISTTMFRLRPHGWEVFS